MGARYRVIVDWTASYADPITLAAGEGLTLTGAQEIWDGHRWLWARNAAGREGWVPDSLVEVGEDGIRARSAYSAVELSCRRGERLEALEETHGWVRCRAESGATGWVPLRYVSPC
ncbi:MAG: SH3 domain-containing protein [Paracoccaceae bacterium]